MQEMNTGIAKLNYHPIGMAQGISSTITRAILDGILKGGQRLVEAELQKQFKVSKSPIREALRDLEKKGLISLIPRKGAIVKAVTAKEIMENYEIRSLLEALAARKGYERMLDEHLDELKRAFSLMKRDAEMNNASEYWEHHQFFHDSYLKSADNQILREILTRLRMHNAWYQTQFFSKNLKRDLLTHTNILRHFTQRDISSKEIEIAMKHHVQLGLEAFKKYIKKMEDGKN